MNAAQSMPPSDDPAPDSSSADPRGGSQQANAALRFHERHTSFAYILPLVVFVIATALEPVPPATGEPEAESTFGITYRHYPLIYTLKLVATGLAIAFAWPIYSRFAWRLTPWSVGVGVVGAAVWIGLCSLRLEEMILKPLGLGSVVDMGVRSAFNPLIELADTPVWAYTFLAIRLVGLVIIVPIVEEFFLRGFLMRFVVRADWWNVPFGEVTTAAVVIGTLVPVLMHPGEMFAAAAWFSLVTWLMVRTRTIWDCVVAHAITNLLLGIYVIATGNWHLM